MIHGKKISGIERRMCRLFSEVISRLANLTRFQRRYRRQSFGAASVVCTAISADDEERLRLFLRAYSHHAHAAQDHTWFAALSKTAPEQHYYVARLGNGIIGAVGLCCLGTHGGCRDWLISGLVVSRRYQGRGIGEKLVRSICSHASGDNDSVYLTVSKVNYRAIQLYKKLGFTDGLSPEHVLLRNTYHVHILPDARLLCKRGRSRETG